MCRSVSWIRGRVTGESLGGGKYGRVSRLPRSERQLSTSVVIRKLIQIQHSAAHVDDGLLGGGIRLATGSMLLLLGFEELQREALFLGIGRPAQSQAE